MDLYKDNHWNIDSGWAVQMAVSITAHSYSKSSETQDAVSMVIECLSLQAAHKSIMKNRNEYFRLKRFPCSHLFVLSHLSPFCYASIVGWWLSWACFSITIGGNWTFCLSTSCSFLSCWFIFFQSQCGTAVCLWLGLSTRSGDTPAGTSMQWIQLLSVLGWGQEGQEGKDKGTDYALLVLCEHLK